MTIKDLLNVPLSQKLFALLCVIGLWSFLFIGVVI